MSRNPRRLSIVGDRLDAHEATLRRVFADGRIDPEEEASIYAGVTAIGGALSCLDSRDQVAAAIAENGLSAYVRRRIRELETTEQRIGWVLMRGGRPDENEAA